MSDDVKVADNTSVNFKNNTITVRTPHGPSIAKKMAKLRLLEERVRIGPDGLTTSTISRVSGSPDERLYVFSW